MKKTFISMLLALALSLGALVTLVSCNETVTDNGNTEESTSAVTDGTGESSPEDESDTSDTVDPDSLYQNGDEINEAGIQWSEKLFASIENTVDESKATDITAAELIALLKDKKALGEGEVYRVKDALVLESDTRYYGNFAAVIAEGGIVIKGVSDVVIKELIIKGSVSVESSDKITFFKTDVQGNEVGVSIDKESREISFKNCRVSAKNTAISAQADLLSVYRTNICAENGLVSEGDELAVQDSMVVATKTGISSKGAGCTVKGNTVEVPADGVGVDFKDGSENGLVALNVIKNAQTSVKMNGAFNCVVLLNSAVTVIGEGCKNLYVVENKLGGKIKLCDNKYLICEGNTFVNDGKDHKVIASGNTEFNGNNLHDVNARAEYGANEELLPHTNKDLFIDMERRDTVRDISQTKKYGVSGYVRTVAQENSIVILAPGVYSTDVAITFDAPHSNTALYGYGVYVERNGRDLTSTNGSITQNGNIISLNSSSNITVKGLTVGYDFQSAGQVHVLEKLSGNRLLVIGNAGYMNSFANADTLNFASNSYIYGAGEFYPWNSNFSFSVAKNNDGSIKRDENGAFVIQLGGSASYVSKFYGAIKAGDILTCRLSGSNSTSINITSSKNVLLKDVVLYGYSSALAIASRSRSSGIKLERVHNTAHSQPIIDKETYDKYVELEQVYGIDLEVSVDELGRCRGGYPRVGSVDAAHINGASDGLSASSCIFEQMCDDGANQRASSSRIAGYHVNNDGTTTIYYKGSISETYWKNAVSGRSTTATPSSCAEIKQGDRIYAYASNGRVLFDTTALTAGEYVTSSPKGHVTHVDKLVNSQIKEGDVTEINGVYDNAPACTDGLCDVCGAVTHSDTRKDGKCDLCDANVHVDFDNNGRCDVTSCTIALSDENGDHIHDGTGYTYPIVTNMLRVSQFSTHNGKYNITGSYQSGAWYNIVYNSFIWEVKVRTSDVNFDAFEGYDLTDNEYSMDNKILLDNLSANSVSFTFDNVLMQNKNARGILCKTRDATIKNCTFRGFTASGILLSVETTWGESTVPQNIAIEGCLFDNTGSNIDTESYFNYAAIVINGLGANEASDVDVSESTLPCRNISIVGNKFTNMNNNYVITVSAAQDIVIKDNVFEARKNDSSKRYGKAIYIDGAMNVEIAGNTYSSFAGGDVTKAIVANNYKNLFGADVESVFPSSKDPIQ